MSLGLLSIAVLTLLNHWTSALNCTSTVKEVCVPCQAGTFANSSLEHCHCCERSGFCAVDTSTELNFCTVCPPGEFQSSDQQDHCQPCRPGFYSKHPGSTQCDICPVGTFQPHDGQTSCLDCQAGTESRLPGSQRCTPCQEGYYKNSTSAALCHPCQPGSSSSTNGSRLCEECPEGCYCNNTGCVRCKPCPTGNEAIGPGQVSCTPCSPGTSKDETSCSRCKTCPTGQYADQPGQQFCLPCPAGYYCACPSCQPKLCPSQAVCPKGSVAPSFCQPPWYQVGQQDKCEFSSTFKAVIGGICGAACAVTLIAFICYKHKKRRRQRDIETSPLVQKPCETPEPVYQGL